MQRVTNQQVPTKLVLRLKAQKMKNAVNKAGVDLLNTKHHPQSPKKVNPLPTLYFKGEITNRQHWNTLPSEVVESKNAWIDMALEEMVLWCIWWCLRAELGDLRGLFQP